MDERGCKAQGRLYCQVRHLALGDAAEQELVRPPELGVDLPAARHGARHIKENHVSSMILGHMGTVKYC
jgi:hypothetical protein